MKLTTGVVSFHNAFLLVDHIDARLRQIKEKNENTGDAEPLQLRFAAVMHPSQTSTTDPNINPLCGASPVSAGCKVRLILVLGPTPAGPLSFALCNLDQLEPKPRHMRIGIGRMPRLTLTLVLM